MGIYSTAFKGSPSEGIVQTSTYLDGPKANQVLVRITHSGICGTDEHFKHKDMVLGHEGVGTVQEVGEAVIELQVGDIVGWGYTHKTCGQCEQCLLGQDQYCPKIEEYGKNNLYQGSFGSHAVWDASFLFKIPEGLAPAHAAPLMCGGATVFGVIESHNIRPTDRVGVVGIGGLGHLAIQFLAKMGASVVVFSSTESKRVEAMRLGATEFYVTKGVQRFDIVQLDHLLVTTNTLPDWKPFIRTMKPQGTIYLLTVASGELRLPYPPMVSLGLTVQGSSIANRSMHRKMLDFAARHKIEPIIEKFPLTKSGVEEGMEKLRQGKMRYRGVLVAQRAAL